VEILGLDVQGEDVRQQRSQHRGNVPVCVGPQIGRALQFCAGHGPTSSGLVWGSNAAGRNSFSGPPKSSAIRAQSPSLWRTIARFLTRPSRSGRHEALRQHLNDMPVVILIIRDLFRGKLRSCSQSFRQTAASSLQVRGKLLSILNSPAILFADHAAPRRQALGRMLLHPLRKLRRAHQAGLH
jgi:hypothetical protein